MLMLSRQCRPPDLSLSLTVPPAGTMLSLYQTVGETCEIPPAGALSGLLSVQPSDSLAYPTVPILVNGQILKTSFPAICSSATHPMSASRESSETAR